MNVELSRDEVKILLRLVHYANTAGIQYEDYSHERWAENAARRLQLLIGASDEQRPDPRCTCDEDSQCGLCSTGKIDGGRFHWGRA